jgi:TAK1-binding protein 2
MDQSPSAFKGQRRTDQSNNQSSSNIKGGSSTKSDARVSDCNCTNISIMQLFHEMKQEFPKVPDHIVQQLVTENCHNRRMCSEQLQKVASSSPSTSTSNMYPSKSIHDNSNKQISGKILTNGSGAKWSNNKKMKEISEMFENTSISSSSTETSISTSEIKMKRPTTLPLRKAPDPPSTSTFSTPSSTTSISSCSSFQQLQPNSQTQMRDNVHHNVVFDSHALKTNDSLRMQVDLKVSPVTISSPAITKRQAPPPPSRTFRSCLNVQPEPPYTKILESKKSPVALPGLTTFGSGATEKKSYTNVTLTLRPPTSLLSSPQDSVGTVDIQAGPQTLTYTSTSFNAKEQSKSHVKITVENGESVTTQAVLTSKNLPERNQIDTTINIEGNYVINDDKQYINNNNNNSNIILPYQMPFSLPNQMTDGNFSSLSMFLYIYKKIILFVLQTICVT